MSDVDTGDKRRMRACKRAIKILNDYAKEGGDAVLASLDILFSIVDSVARNSNVTRKEVIIDFAKHLHGMDSEHAVDKVKMH